MTNEELINQRKKEITELTSQIDKSKINYNLPMGSWVSNKESEISDRERMTIKEGINQAKIEMLTELQSEIEGLPMYYDPIDISDLIQEKINALKGDTQMQKEFKKLRDICRSYDSCYDGCPLNVDNGDCDCVMTKPPSNWSDEDIEKITQLVKGENNGIHEN